MFLLFTAVTNIGSAQNLPTINKAEKTFYLYMDKYDETPLIFGYDQPDVNSEKVICFSSFTEDVEHNPHKCIMGAYYETGELVFEYVETIGDFVKVKMIVGESTELFFYMEVKNVKFD